MTGREHLRVGLAVDLAILTVREELLHVLVIERANEPHRGRTRCRAGSCGKARACARRPRVNSARRPASMAAPCTWSNWPLSAPRAVIRGAGWSAWPISRSVGPGPRPAEAAQRGNRRLRRRTAVDPI